MHAQVENVHERRNENDEAEAHHYDYVGKVGQNTRVILAWQVISSVQLVHHVAQSPAYMKPINLLTYITIYI